MKFSPWAPETLVSYYRFVCETIEEFEKNPDPLIAEFVGKHPKEYRELVERLLSESEMKGVWALVDERMTGEEIDFAYLIYDALALAKGPHYRKSQVVEEIKKLADDLRQIAEKITAKPMIETSIIFKGTVLPELNNEGKSSLDMPKMKPSTVLVSLAGRVDDVAKGIKDSFFFLSKPSVTDSFKIHFIRQMGLTFMLNFGGYNYERLAALARVVLDDPNIDKEFVHQRLRDWIPT
jgi:hypothetical protein